ncbi:hypothetical protein PVK06_007997 [Gossypium arboreum]|uniref:Uncharacterized protein n=1 Tax=Gossypium arboreum TaxID=29729 RepID=A0ABR0QJS3_GOSAR|nr:hypothetical protein PVK06_007997 [Gossypium arboreum]
MAEVREITTAEFLQMGYMSITKGAFLRCSSRSQPKAMASGNVPTSLVNEQPRLVEKPAQEVVHFYRIPLIQESANEDLLKSV